MKEFTEAEIAAIVNGVPKDNLVLFCPGLHGRGATLIDRSPSANHGTITNPAWTRTPRGFVVPTSPSLINFGNAASLQILNNLSILVWMKTSSTYSSAAQWAYTYIIAKWVVSGLQQSWALVRLNPDSGTQPLDCYGLVLGNAATGALAYMGYLATPLAASTWYQFGITFASGTLVLYLNGEAVAISTRSEYSTPPSTLFNATASVYMRQTANALNTAEGMPLIYSGSPVLTAAQIAQIYTRQRHLFGV